VRRPLGGVARCQLSARVQVARSNLDVLK
jgi:hypothetical protein